MNLGSDSLCGETPKTSRSLLLLILALAGAPEQKLQFNPVVDTPVDFTQVRDSDAYVKGNWVPLNERSKLPGVSMSEITCDRHLNLCRELQGNLVISENMFSIVPDQVEYKVVRWNSEEIVANAIGGTCKTLNSLKFDRKNKKVYAIQSLSEPIENLPNVSRRLQCCGFNMGTSWRDHVLARINSFTVERWQLIGSKNDSRLKRGLLVVYKRQISSR
jgi:hypothetical protein